MEVLYVFPLEVFSAVVAAEGAAAKGALVAAAEDLEGAAAEGVAEEGLGGTAAEGVEGEGLEGTASGVEVAAAEVLESLPSAAEGEESLDFWLGWRT